MAKRNISKEPNSVIGRLNEFLFMLESDNLRVLNLNNFFKYSLAIGDRLGAAGMGSNPCDARWQGWHLI